MYIHIYVLYMYKMLEFFFCFLGAGLLEVNFFGEVFEL